ncbi:MAG: hypothetical protein ACTHJ2_00590 [Candidatus Nitrosocosmicus sp.]
MDDHKLGLDEKNTSLQSQIERSFDIQIQQTSLPKPPPLLEFKRQKDENIKDSVEQREQKTTEKDFLDKHKEVTGISIQKAIIRYNLINTDRLIDYYRQASQPLIHVFLESLNLQKDYINAFQPQWIDNMKNMVENYLGLRDKMILLYIQNYNTYLNNVFGIEKKNNNNKRTDK